MIFTQIIDVSLTNIRETPLKRPKADTQEKPKNTTL